MHGEVTREPDETTREVWAFGVVIHKCPRVTFTRYEVWKRAGESCPWELKGFWQYPDLFGNSTLEEPSEVPDWAKLDARTYIANMIHFNDL